MRRLHQTRLSAAIKRNGVTRYAASRWWIRTQSRYLRRAINDLSVTLDSGGAESVIPEDDELAGGYSTHGDSDDGHRPDKGECLVLNAEPSLASLNRMSDGEAFSQQMAASSRSPKLLSITLTQDSTGYCDVYAAYLSRLRDRQVSLLEIGVGIADPRSRSGESFDYEVGTSLKGWSNFFTNSRIIGADCDPRALIQDPKFITTYMDQSEPATIRDVAQRYGPFDIVIDDGLHTPEANGNVIRELLPALRPGGLMFIEDIPLEFHPLWEDVAATFPAPYQVAFIPHHALRQQRGSGGEVGIAVISAALPRLTW